MLPLPTPSLNAKPIIENLEAKKPARGLSCSSVPRRPLHLPMKLFFQCLSLLALHYISCKIPKSPLSVSHCKTLPWSHAAQNSISCKLTATVGWQHFNCRGEGGKWKRCEVGNCLPTENWLGEDVGQFPLGAREGSMIWGWSPCWHGSLSPLPFRKLPGGPCSLQSPFYPECVQCASQETSWRLSDCRGRAGLINRAN